MGITLLISGHRYHLFKAVSGAAFCVPVCPLFFWYSGLKFFVINLKLWLVTYMYTHKSFVSVLAFWSLSIIGVRAKTRTPNYHLPASAIMYGTNLKPATMLYFPDVK